ncbi:MAG: CPBP family intramembrane glutamic endopeptidase [Clostridiaceae bacterium]
MKKDVKLYLIISFGWTWSLWIIAYLISSNIGHKLVTDMDIFSMFPMYINRNGFLPQVVFALAVLGPMFGYFGSENRKPFWGDPKKEIVLLTIIFPIVMVIPTFILSSISGQFSNQSISMGILFTIITYFVSNLITSGTEEFGWRGYLYPALKEKNMTFGDIAWKGGLLWALWHFPLIFFLYFNQGIFVLLPSFIGFTAGIIAMNYITNFIYEKSKSIFLSMILHAMNNTASFTIMLFFPKTSFLFISSIMAWAVVAYIEKKYKLNSENNKKIS